MTSQYFSGNGWTPLGNKPLFKIKIYHNNPVGYLPCRDKHFRVVLGFHDLFGDQGQPEVYEIERTIAVGHQTESLLIFIINLNFRKHFCRISTKTKFYFNEMLCLVSAKYWLFHSGIVVLFIYLIQRTYIRLLFQAVSILKEDTSHFFDVCMIHIHYDDVIMGAMASQITSLMTVYSTVYSDADQRKHQSSASLAFVRGIHRGPVNSPHKWTKTRKMFLRQHPKFDTFVMYAVNDIALIKLATRVNLKNPFVSVANMAEPGTDFLGSECRLTGWGLKDTSRK